MVEKYKLTDEKGLTRHNTRWEIGVTNFVLPERRRPELCSDGVLHAYHHPRVAVLMNPRHAAFKNPRMFLVEGREVVADDGLKCGMYEQTVLRELEVPVASLERAAAFGILCALEVYHDAAWRKWAMGWLDGSDRSFAAAAAAAYAAAYAYAAADAAAYAADAAVGKSIDFGALADKAFALFP